MLSLEIPSLTLTIGSRNLEKIHRTDVLTVAGDAGGGVDPLCAGGGRLLPHPGLPAPDAGHGGRDLGAPGGFLMDCLYPSMRCVQMEQPAILYPKFVLIY